MNTTLRALFFGTAAALAMTVTLDTVTAAEPREVVRLDAVEVTAHRDNFDADGNLRVVRLDAVTVVGRKAVD